MTKTEPAVSITEGQRVRVFRKGLQNTGRHGEVLKVGGGMALVLIEVGTEWPTAWLNTEDLEVKA